VLVLFLSRFCILSIHCWLVLFLSWFCILSIHCCTCSIPVSILYIIYTLLCLFYSCLDSVYYLYIVGLFYSCLDSVYYLYIVVLVLFLSRFCILSIHCCTCSIPVLILYIIYTLLCLFYSCLDSVYYLYIVGLFYSCLDSVYYLYIVVLVLFLTRFCILSIHNWICSRSEDVWNICLWSLSHKQLLNAYQYK
jgi:hypothetical protein